MLSDQRTGGFVEQAGTTPLAVLVRALQKEQRDIGKVIALLERVQEVRLRRKRSGSPEAPIAHARSVAAAAPGGATSARIANNVKPSRPFA